ncbi:putative epidermal cell surface receptor isoform X3 [Galleria mellonella]|uniref:Epidermal cell surface receptor isoform X3 n=1 Tax=Galleria mellonella TaxID=7137 RepID=A0ABM3MYN2_GALME|nr:putative epidermal cell surface receptor isoform X3 [Galleria mellonella]
MGMWSGVVALWCAAVVITAASGYTVDCNHEYTDCDTELSKIISEDEDVLPQAASNIEVTATAAPTTTTASPTRSTVRIDVTTENKTEIEVTTVVADVTESIKPKPRLLNLNVDDLQSFANALHNQTDERDHKKHLGDLSDVNLDGEEEEEPSRIAGNESKNNNVPDKFFSNLQAPFHPLLTADKGSDEMDTCRENEVTYKIGERVDRGCEETCECTSGGVFECSPKCKHPYIRRGRRLNDPLCFESPVDDCCSIIACATGNGEPKPTRLEVCRYGNDTYPVGSKWNIGCEQSCICERNSIVTCKPRCNPIPPSDKCINVQDPKDACCEVQVCDVSQDVHEEIDNITSSTTASSYHIAKGSEESEENIVKSTMRPLVLTEPIGSVKVLQNNTVQVNLMHMNNSEDPIHLLLSSDGGKSFKDVELKYSNLILNLEGGKDYILKTKETGTKFNFTITATDSVANEVPTEDVSNATKIGCYQDGHFYAVGEEFHIGCTELCECTGDDERECAALVCPSHVGLELMSRGCVRWDKSPPAQPPNCCPRTARCLSNGTCNYNGVLVPNWNEVPLSLTGCELRCFCENGEVDCQEACSPLPPVPPPNFRCPPMHRPAPVNISDDDCCKHWGCVPNAGFTNGSYYDMSTTGGSSVNYVTPVAPLSPMTTSVLPQPQDATDPIDFYKHLSPVKSFPKIIKTTSPIFNDIPKYSIESAKHGDNITVFTLDDLESPFKIIHPDTSLTSSNSHWEMQHQEIVKPSTMDTFKLHSDMQPTRQLYRNHKPNFILSDVKMHDIIKEPVNKQPLPIESYITPNGVVDKTDHGPINNLPSQTFGNYFSPAYEFPPPSAKVQNIAYISSTIPPKKVKFYFEPVIQNQTSRYLLSKDLADSPTYNKENQEHPFYNMRGKHITILRSKDFKTAIPPNNVNDINLWGQDTKTHLLSKVPNPYETVLLRAVPNTKIEVSPTLNGKGPHNSDKAYTALDLEHLLNQMEVESEVNRNLGRSADKNKNAVASGNIMPSDFPSQSSRPFLPTVRPEIHFPQEDIPDYGQNNIHHPSIDGLPGLPPGLPIPPAYGDDNKKLVVLSMQADSPTSVKMLFGLPPVLVGLRGSVDLRYTDQADDDISHWYSQVFAPTDEVLTTPRLEFSLNGLKPSTTYKIRGKLFLHNLPVEPESEIRVVRTLDLPTIASVEEKRREIDSQLTVMEVNDTSAHMSWRHFTEEELQFIDGIQIRYRPVGTPIYSMTELLHHSRSTAELHDLRPGSQYEASLVLVPPPRALTELHDPGIVEFTTLPYVDPYNWTVTIEARAVGSEAAELTWRGVPSPAERWVRVYRAAHACGTPSPRKEHDAFRLAARDLPPSVTLTGLEPNAKCRVWLELFLTNGKVKTSNVLEINTKSLDSPEPVDNEIEAAGVSGSRSGPRGDYYGALVVVGVVAALGALTSLLLLLVVVRRHRPRSVAITPLPTAPRESSLPPYDNPAYKLELQQETMDL